MRENGTDRDIALLIASSLSTISETLTTINANLYSPVILTQPTDQVGAIGDTVTFTLVAANAVHYEWQYKSTGAWTGITDDNPSHSVSVLEARYAYLFRCIVTGKDGSTVTSNEVKILAPES